jgi:large subunit ribosomal protein L23
MTEKSVRLAKQGKYTFLVPARASAGKVAEEIKALYQVEPIDVSLTSNPAKRKGTARTARVRPARRKAIVTLPPGTKIPDFILEEEKRHQD